MPNYLCSFHSHYYNACGLSRRTVEPQSRRAKAEDSQSEGGSNSSIAITLRFIALGDPAKRDSYPTVVIIYNLAFYIQRSPVELKHSTLSCNGIYERYSSGASLRVACRSLVLFSFLMCCRHMLQVAQGERSVTLGVYIPHTSPLKEDINECVANNKSVTDHYIFSNVLLQRTFLYN